MYEKQHRFDTYEEALVFYDEINGVDHRCIGIVLPIRTLVEDSGDTDDFWKNSGDDEEMYEDVGHLSDGGDDKKTSYVVTICAHGPRVREWEKRLVVDQIELRNPFHNLNVAAEYKDARISDNYKTFIRDLISLFLRLEQTNIMVCGGIEDIRLSSPLRNDNFIHPQIVCTGFKCVSSKSDKKKVWETLHNIIQKINTTFDISCSSMEMESLLTTIKAGNVSDQIFRLPIFQTSAERIAFINNLWGDMEADPGRTFYYSDLDDCILEFRSGLANYHTLSLMVTKEKDDSDRKKQKKQNQAGTSKKKNNPPVRTGKECELFQMMDSLRQCNIHFERMRKELTITYEGFPLKKVEDFQLLVECAVPSLVHCLCTRYPAHVTRKTDYPE